MIKVKNFALIITFMSSVPCQAGALGGHNVLTNVSILQMTDREPMPFAEQERGQSCCNPPRNHVIALACFGTSLTCLGLGYLLLTMNEMYPMYSS